MPDTASFFNKIYHYLLTALSTLLIFSLLLVFRQADDNRLVSWNWAFAGIDVSSIFFFLILGLIAAYGLSKMSFPHRYPLVFLVSSSVIVCSLMWGEPEIVVDVSRYFTQARHLSEYGIKYFLQEWGYDINAWTDLPLLPFLYGLIFKFIGESRVYIQVFTTLLFTMTVVSNYLLARTLWDENAGFNAGLLLLGMPYLLTQTPLMLVDIATMFFLTFSLYAFIMVLKKGSTWHLISSITIFLAVFSKYSSWMLLSVLAIALLVYLVKPAELYGQPVSKSDVTTAGLRIQFIKNASLTLLFAGIFIGTIVFFKFEVISEQIHLLMTYQKPALKGWSESYVSTFFYQVHPFITLAAIYSFYGAFKNKDLKYIVISWLVVLLILSGVRRIRYMLPVFPMLALMAAYGFQAVRDIRLRNFMVLSTIICSILIAVFVYLPFLQKMGPVNLMHAGKFIDSLEAPDIEVLTMPSNTTAMNQAVAVPLLDFYTEKGIYYDYQKTSPPANVKTSPLRFTWTYENPAYYETDTINGKPGNMPLVLITSGEEEKYPEYIKRKHYRKAAEFNTSTGFFRYSPTVIVFIPDG